MPRINSYINFIENKNVALSDPRVGIQTDNDISKILWVKPESGDRCWVDLNCTMEEGEIVVDSSNFFSKAYKK